MQTNGSDAGLSDGLIAALPLRRRGASRARILAATRQLLSRQSYDALTMDAVADAARLTRRTIYHQFVGRQSLYRASREALAHGVGRALPTTIPVAWPERTTLLHFAADTLYALSTPEGTELLLSLLRDTEERGWVAALYDRHCRSITCAAVSRWLLATGRGDRPLAVAQFAALIEAFALAPCLATPGPMPPTDRRAMLQPVVDSFLAMFGQDHR